MRPVAGDASAAFVPTADSPDAPALLAVANACCVFFDAERSHHCRIQHTLGHAALPLACRQFPRVTVQTPRGASVTLSHYCPTAAALLRTDGPVTIETGAPSFPASGEYVGLDARESLPPLLRPGLLMDWDAWFEWERRSVDLLCNGQGSVEEALGRLHAAVEHVRHWRPGDRALLDAVGEAFDVAGRDAPTHRMDAARRMDDVLSAIPPAAAHANFTRLDPRTQAMARESPEAEKRFLAAHAFANWTAHLGTGLRSWFRSIEAACALLEAGFAPGDADLLLRHLAETSLLTEAWNQAEN